LSTDQNTPFSSCPLLYNFIVHPAITYTSTAWYLFLGTLYACKYVLTDHMPRQNNCLTAISGAYKATPIRNSEVELGVPPLEILVYSIQTLLTVSVMS
jgi:hypothetical protein